MIASAQASPVELPVLARFAIIMAICLTVPPLCRRIRIPACVGLLFVGVAVGPNELHLSWTSGTPPQTTTTVEERSTAGLPVLEP
jgi:Kef-type K+ transport system membrane component KefB